MVGHINQRTGNLSVKQTAAHLCWFIILGSEEFRITKRKQEQIQTKALQTNMVLGTYTILRILMKIIGIWTEDTNGNVEGFVQLRFGDL